MTSSEQESAIDEYVRHGHRSIPGWLWQSAAYLTAILGLKQFEDGITGNVGEIGVWQGRYLYLLGLLSRPEEKVIGIDSFVHSPDPVGFANAVTRRFESHVATAGKLVLIKHDSTMLTPETIGRHAAGNYRLFSIDGGHLAEEVLSDAMLVSQMMAPGGIIVMDDILNSTCPGVIEGTLDFLKSPCGQSYEPFCLVGNKLLITDRDSAGGYRDYLLRLIDNNRDVSLFRDTAQSLSDFPEGVRPRLCGSELIVITWSGDCLVSDNGVPVLIRTKVCDLSELDGPDTQLPPVGPLVDSISAIAG